MAQRYPQRYWWLVLIVVPLVIAVIPEIRRLEGGAPAIIAMSISPRRITTDVGTQVKLTAEVRTTSGAVQRGVVVEWNSIDESIASVTNGGILTGLKEGQTEIVAEYAGMSAGAHVVVTGARAAATPPDGISPAPDPSDVSREEVLKITTAAIDYIRRGDLSFVQSHAGVPFFFGGAMFGTRDSVNGIFPDGAASVRRTVEAAELVKVTAHMIRDLRSRDWFPGVTSFVPIPIEDTDWGALISTKLRAQPSVFITWVVVFRSEQGSWRIVGVTASNSFLE